MTVTDTNTLIEKAKSRNDGVYSYKGYYWAAKNNRFVAFVSHYGECFQVFGSFNVKIGECKESYLRKQKLKEHLKVM